MSVITNSGDSNEDSWYELSLQGHLDPRWSTWLDGMDLLHRSDGTTVVRGPIVDQSALHGLLARLRDIGLPLLSVTRMEPHQPKHPAHPDSSNEE
jgi:hypothetical protein